MPTKIRLRGGAIEYAPTQAEQDREYITKNFVKILSNMLDDIENLYDLVEDLRKDKTGPKPPAKRKSRKDRTGLDQYLTKKKEIIAKIKSARVGI